MNNKWIVAMLCLALVCFILGFSAYSLRPMNDHDHNLDAEDELTVFIEPNSSEWVEFINPVREYMYYRTQAVVNNEIAILWNRYPLLQTNINQEQGINSEQILTESLNKSFNLIDANYDMERNGRIKINKISETEAVVLVHGMITYVREDFDISGGELLIKVFLEGSEGDWTVVKTDEYTLPEYKEWIKTNG